MDAASGEIIVTITDDGRLFECAVAKVGAQREERWLLIDSDSRLHIGPAWCGDLPEPQLRSLVNDWWRTIKRRNAWPR
jgi:hypothetical protein